jgi:hypothetical protein
MEKLAARNGDTAMTCNDPADPSGGQGDCGWDCLIGG